MLLDFLSFLFFLSYIEWPNPWKVDQELKKEKKEKKEIICSGTYLSRCSFFLLPRFLSCRVLVIHDRTVKDPR